MIPALLTPERVRWIERLTAVAGVVLMVAILWFLVRLVLALWPRGDAALDVVPARLPESTGNSPSVSLSRWHLFGNPGAGPQSGRALPTSNLPLTLRGTVAERSAEAGVAVISNGESERAYRVGDEIDAGVKLVEVHPEHVVVDRAGTRESLRLPRESASVTTGGPPTPPGTAAPAQAAAPSSDTAPLFVAPPLAHGTINWQQTLDQVRENPVQFTQLAQPVLQDGKLLGMRIRGLDADTMARLGLQPSDLVTSVNGIAIDSPSRAAEILSSVQNAASVRVTVTRDGKPVELTIAKP